jgi:hypothetical protein
VLRAAAAVSISRKHWAAPRSPSEAAELAKRTSGWRQHGKQNEAASYQHQPPARASNRGGHKAGQERAGWRRGIPGPLQGPERQPPLCTGEQVQL